MSGERLDYRLLGPWLALCLSPALFGAGTPTLVADLATSLDPRSSAPAEIHRAGDRVVFAASEAAFGRELHAYSSATAETDLLVDASPGTADSAVVFVAEVAGRLFYWSGPATWSLLYRTDGTPSGTRLVADASGAQIVLETLQPTVATGGQLYVRGLDSRTGRAGFWCVDSDGRATRLWLDSTTGIQYGPIYGIAVSGSRVFFLESPSDQDMTTVWVTDGRADGTRPVSEVRLYPDAEAFATDARYLFSGRVFDEAGMRWVLYSSDGTEEGTEQLGEWAGDSEVRDFRLLGANRQRAYFETLSPEFRSHLWLSDGTRDGTRRVPRPADARWSGDFEHPPVWFGDDFIFWSGVGTYPDYSNDYWSHDGSDSAPTRLRTGAQGEHAWLTPLIPLGDRLLFVSLDAAGEGEEIWARRRGGAEVEQLSDLCPPECIEFDWISGVALGDSALLTMTIRQSHFGSSWIVARSDGTGGGTRAIARNWEGEAEVSGGYPGGAAAVDGGYLLVGSNAQSGSEPWFVGEADGELRQVANLEPENGPSSPVHLLAAAPGLYFATPELEEGDDLWRLGGDGHPELLPPADCRDDFFEPVGTVGGRVLFQGGYQCLVSFEPEARTWETLVGSDYPLGAKGTTVGESGVAYFVRAESELWRTDGTRDGTRRIFGQELSDSLVIAAATSTHVYLRSEWYEQTLTSVRIEDGAAETILNLAPLYRPSPPGEFLPIGSHLFFTSKSSPSVESLWGTTGRSAETTLLWTSTADERVLDLYALAGELYFVVAGERGALWRSDGTPGGTRRVADLGEVGVDADDGSPRPGIALGGRLFFVAGNDAAGVELWSSDGTEAGTRLHDLVPGVVGSDPRELTAVAGRIFFSATDAVSGREVWTFDPATGRGWRVGEVADGALSSVPEELTAVGSLLYFSADDGGRGRELWVLDAAAVAAPCLATSESLCLLAGRFEVEASWRDFRGRTGRASGSALAAGSALFSFVPGGGAELMVKLVEVCLPPGRGETWIYAAGLTNLDVTLTLRDTRTDERIEWRNELGRIFEPRIAALAGERCAYGAVTGSSSPPPASAVHSAALAPGSETEAALTLLGGRFVAAIDWGASSGSSDFAAGVPIDDRSGYFWFFDAAYPEVLVRMVDACGLAGFDNFWVFAAGLTDVEVHLTVTDTWSGEVVRHDNLQGQPFPTLLETGKLHVCAAAP